MNTQIIGVRDLFGRFKEVLRYIAKGGEFVIVRHSKPVAKIVPYEQKFIDTEEELDKIVPQDELHASIIEGHREYLRGNTTTLEEFKKELNIDDDEVDSGSNSKS